MLRSLHIGWHTPNQTPSLVVRALRGTTMSGTVDNKQPGSKPNKPSIYAIIEVEMCSLHHNSLNGLLSNIAFQHESQFVMVFEWI